MTPPTLTVSWPASEVVINEGSVVLNVPVALKRRSGRRWLRVLETGQAASMSDIARRESTDHSYIARHINLTLLALEIVAAILDEALPAGLQLMDLAINPPVPWAEQISLLTCVETDSD